jgi:hypothetical protein
MEVIMDKDEVFIDTEEIAEYLTENLIQRGFCPCEEEIEEITDIMFQFLVEKSVCDEVDEEGWD